MLWKSCLNCKHYSVCFDIGNIDSYMYICIMQILDQKN